MPIECKVVEKTAKNGEKYICLEIKLTPTYIKTVFLENAEKELIKLVSNQHKG